MEKILQTFEVKYLQILDENGNADEKLMPKLSPSMIKKMYEQMVFTRVFDDRALKLQRQGRIGTYAPMRGQEGCQLGTAFALGKEDMVFPAFRENGIFMLRGIKPEAIYSFWGGDERGMKVPRSANIFPVAITVGAHPPHAVGAAMAFKLQKKKAATVVYFGDGATSEGDFHEAMNFAGVYKAPTVFVCQNNQWAISVPVKEQTAAETMAQKAIAYGFEGIRIDGNDIFAAYKAMEEALKKAKAGKGPTFIECLTYRMGDHTTSDQATKYRPESEVKKWEDRDPILRLKRYMIKKKMFSEKYEKAVLAKAEKEVDRAVQKYESTPLYDPKEIFNYMYAQLTPDLVEQQANMKIEKVENKTPTSAAKEKGMGVVGELEEAKE